MVLISFLMLFWPPKVVVILWGYFNPQNVKNRPMILFLVGFCLNLSLNFFELWLFPGNQSYCVLLVWKLLLWSSLRKSYSVYRENSDMAKFWPFKTKIWPFFGQNTVMRLFTYNFQAPPWIFLIFGMEVVLMVLFDKIILYMPWKFWYDKILAI